MTEPPAGRATPEGTGRFRERFPDLAEAGHFRQVGGLWLSSIGLGTYLGEADDATDASYEAAVELALAAGCNVFDSAVNYRHQRSERALGRALARAFAAGLAARDEVFVSTKGGFLPFDGGRPVDLGAFLRTTYLDSGLIPPGELAAGCHAMVPAFLRDQLARSRRNLGLATVDLYYLHNPETQLGEVDRAAFEARLGRAFATLEEAAGRGEAGAWGIATWSGLRVPPNDPGHLGLARLMEVAREATGRVDPGFAAVQLPLSLALPEALVAPTQPLDGAQIPPLAAARGLGLAAFTSGSIGQGRLAARLPPEIERAFPGLDTDAQRALQFTRSAPGVAVALVGMGDPEHVRENLALAALPPAGVEAFQRIFGGAGPS